MLKNLLQSLLKSFFINKLEVLKIENYNKSYILLL